MGSPAQYNNAPVKTMWVNYEGTDTLLTGYPLCFNFDYGTAADADEERSVRVEKPSTGNAMHFAGVVHPQSNGKSTGPVRIILPGSTCLVYTNQNCSIGTRITAQAGQYRFYTQGFQGKGSAVCLQTVDRSSTAGTVLARLEDGEQSGLVEVVTPANGAMTIGTYGVTYFPATTIATGNATYTLADGAQLGQRKAFVCEGTMTTNDVVVTVTTKAIIPSYAAGPLAITAYGVFTMDDAAEHLYAFWNGKAWVCFGSVAS